MTAGQKPTAPADPVRGLMRQHRELCEHAVDPLEIAAGLEARGVTDRTAARFKHRDVFSLAEELYARVPHADQRAMRPARAVREPVTRVSAPRAGALLWPLLPGALCAATVGLLALVRGTPPYARYAVALVGALAVCAGVRLALRALPLSKSLVLYAAWLTAYALLGDWLLGELLGGGPEIPPVAVSPPPGAALTLALAVAPAAWCARAFSQRARRGLTGSRSLEEFAAGVRPLLAATVVLFTCCLLGLQWALLWGLRSLSRWTGGALDGLPGTPGAATGLTPGAFAATTGLGVLLFTALLLTAHGFGAAASAGLAAACAVEAAALTCVLAARLPGLAPLGRPVERAVGLLGTPAVPLTACVCAALGLLAYASLTLTGASAHHRVAAPT